MVLPKTLVLDVKRAGRALEVGPFEPAIKGTGLREQKEDDSQPAFPPARTPQAALNSS